MAPTADPTDAPVVSVTALMTPSSTVNPGHTVPVEDTSMYLHFLPHCVLSFADILSISILHKLCNIIYYINHD